MVVGEGGDEEKLSGGRRIEGRGVMGGGWVWRGRMPVPIWEVLPHFLPVETGQCQRAPAGPGLAEWANAMWHVTGGI